MKVRKGVTFMLAQERAMYTLSGEVMNKKRAHNAKQARGVIWLESLVS